MMVNTKIRKANSGDVKDILRLLIELAVYEKEPDAVKVTEQELTRDGFGKNPKYKCIDKHMIRFIMWITKGPTDTKSTYEFTDWDKVDSFAKELIT